VYKANLNSRSLRTSLLLGAASVAAMGIALPAMAQDNSSVETVVVTGSRIPQTGLYSTSPVTVVGSQEAKLEGTTNVDQLLNNLPSVYAGQNQYQGNGSTGTATVDLRGLGANRTLVLIDGKRLGAGDPIVPVADLNQIPAAMVDHVEVLTGGASAVYGSDAEAGVVNFIMRKDFEGIELDGQYSAFQHQNDNGNYRSQQSALGFPLAPSNAFDGQNVNTTLVMGTNTANDKGNVTVYLSYQNTVGVLAGARDYGNCTFNDAGATAACGGSSNFNSFVNLNDGVNYHPVPGGLAATYPKFNYGALNSMQRPDTRYTGGFFAHYDVSKELELYSSLMFTHDDANWTAAPSGAFEGTAIPGNSGAVMVNCDNPYLNSAELGAWCGGVASPTKVPFYIGRRNVEGGNRVTDYTHETYRMVVGAKGDLGDGWSYDVSGQYSRTDYSQTYNHDFSVARVQNALLVNPDGKCQVFDLGIDKSCVPYNIFNGILPGNALASTTAGGVTAAALNYVTAQGLQQGYTDEQVLTGSLTGNLGAWGIQSPWAKTPVGVSVGAEYRSEEISLTTSHDYHLNDLYGSGGYNFGTPTSGFNVTEGFGEVSVPVIEGMPFAEELSLNGGYRYSSYSSSGAVSSYKYGAEWQPIDDLRLRAGFQRAVRAPNVLELFTPVTGQLDLTTDPCAKFGNANPTTGAAQPLTAAQVAGCERTGATLAQLTGGPGGLSTIQDCPATQCKYLVGGNTNLKPEVSDSRTLGIVLTPTFLDGFTATVDYYDIKIDKAITSISPITSMNECVSGNNVAYCGYIHRDANGAIFTDNGYVVAPLLNSGYLRTKGVDVEANYQAEMSDWGMGDNGSLAFNLVGTYTKNYTVEQVSGALNVGTYDCAGLFGLSCGEPTPKWRHKLRVTWDSPWDFAVSLQWRYIGSTTNDANSSNTLIGTGPGSNVFNAKLPAYNYFDLSGTWAVSEHVNLSAGVNNLFDKDPPLIATDSLGTYGNNNTFPGTYDPLGRYVFVAGSVKF